MKIHLPISPDELEILKDHFEEIGRGMRPVGLVNEANPGGPPAAVAPAGDAGAAGAAAAPAADAAGAGADANGAAAAAADPRVLEQMQQQLTQFGGVIGQVAEHLPTLEALTQQQGAGGQNGAGAADPNALPGGLDGLAQQFAELYGQPQTDEFGNPIQGAPDPAQLVEQFRQVIRDEVSPLSGRLDSMTDADNTRQLQALQAQLPVLRDPQQSPAIAERVVEVADMFAKSTDPRERAAEIKRLALNPNLVRTVALAHLGEMQARGETPAGAPGPDVVEGAGGTSPDGAQIDPGDAIVAAGRGGNDPAGAYFR